MWGQENPQDSSQQPSQITKVVQVNPISKPRKMDWTDSSVAESTGQASATSNHGTPALRDPRLASDLWALHIWGALILRQTLAHIK